MREPVGVAVWGIGPHARRNVLPAFRSSPSTVLVGVSTRDRGVGEDVAHAHGCRYWADPAAMLADPRVHAVYLATPIGVHFTQGMQVLRAGRHLWCEKSLASSLSESRTLIATAREAGLAVFETFMYRYHPQFRTIQARVADPSFGDVVGLSCRFGLPPLDAPGFRGSRALGGGALHDVGCYVVSAASALLGPGLEVVHSDLHTPPGAEVDRDGVAVLRAPSGASSLLQWGGERAYRADLMVWGERGSLDAERVFSKPRDLTTTVRLRDLRGNVEEVPIPAADAFAEMLTRFAAASVQDGARAELMREAEEQAVLLEWIWTRRQPDPLRFTPSYG